MNFQKFSSKFLKKKNFAIVEKWRERERKKENDNNTSDQVVLLIIIFFFLPSIIKTSTK